MGKIKSALEIALERTESVKGDKGSIGLFEAKQKGKKLANEFLECAADPSAGTLSVKSLEEEIKKTSQEERENLKQGIFDILTTRLTLPKDKDDLKLIEAACLGLEVIIKNKNFGNMVKQLVQILDQFLDETAKYEEAIIRQYGPKLQQKEEELSRRMGRQVKLDPFQDPEFVAFYNQHISGLRDNYQGVLDQAREEAEKLFTGH